MAFGFLEECQFVLLVDKIIALTSESQTIRFSVNIQKF